MVSADPESVSVAVKHFVLAEYTATGCHYEYD